MLLLCGATGWYLHPQEKVAIANVVQARKGRVVFCTSSGGLFLNLSPEH